MPSPPSDRRLHPVSFVFTLGSQLRQLVLPGLFVLFAGARGGDAWQIWLMVLILPFALISIARALVFRYRMDPEELVLQSGLLFRQQRHVPYDRIQNIDAIRNVLHRLLGVAEVRIETAGGQEPEAHLTVVSLGAFEELREWVMARRAARGGAAGTAGTAAAQGAPAAPEPTVVLLRLPARELVIAGLIQGRGLIVIGALFGLLWETGLLDRATAALFGDDLGGRGLVRQLLRAAMTGSVTPWRSLALTAAAFVAFLIVTRLFSVAWSLVRLHGFTLSRTGGDLRIDFGLFTRVSATIPLRRIQTVTVLDGPLHRLFGRASVRIETAGGEGDESVRLQRQWLAPVITAQDVPAMCHAILPSVDATRVAWHPVDPRGVRRARIAGLVRVTALSAVLLPILEWMTPVLFLAGALATELDARRSVRALRWGATDSGVFLRSGWVWRREMVAPCAKIQAVAVLANPFDRRLSMARVEVDTAGGGAAAHRLSVPYLARETADTLAATLGRQAARTAFRW